MDTQEILAKQLPLYARVLLQKGINLQQGQILVINAPVEASRFATLLAEEAYKGGAGPVRWYLTGTAMIPSGSVTSMNPRTILKPCRHGAVNSTCTITGRAPLS